jgi:hypothetical protein
MGRINTRSGLAPVLDLQELGSTTVIYGEIDDPSMRDFNPSLAWHDDKLWMTIRRCNFAINKSGSWYLRDGNAYSKTDVMIGGVDPDDLDVSYLKKLELKGAPTRTLVCGLEDVRLFSRPDGLHAIGYESDRLTKSLHNGSAKMAEYLVQGDELVYLRTLDKPNPELPEKNWSPTNIQSKAFDFTYSPTQVWKDGKVIGTPTNSILHGGSQLLKQSDGTYLSLVHDKVADPYIRTYNRYKYRTYLARHNKEGIIIELTQPFTFGTHENIEFASGMVEYKDDFLISLGIRDCKYAIVRMNKDKLIDILQPWGTL